MTILYCIRLSAVVCFPWRFSIKKVAPTTNIWGSYFLRSWLYIFQRDNALEYLPRARRGNNRAVIRALWFVYDHKRKIFGFIRGEKPNE